MSFSFAFVIFTLTGCIARIGYVVWQKRWAGLIPPVMICLLVGFNAGLITGTIDLSSGQELAQPAHVLRDVEHFDNRSLPEMQRLLEQYAAGDIETILFGVAADAASQLAPTSQVGLRIFTDFGVVGFALLAAGFGLASIGAVARLSNRGWLILYIASFGLSFYQRPIIWLPYNLLVFMGGMSLAGCRRESSRPDQASSS